LPPVGSIFIIIATSGIETRKPEEPMEIIIGAAAPVGMPGLKIAASGSGNVEAKILNIRSPRRRQGQPPDGERDRRGKKNPQDPMGGRVIVLLVPDAYNLPVDLGSGNYRIFLRFVPCKNEKPRR